MNRENEILENAVAALKRETGLEAEYRLPASHHQLKDFEIKVTQPDGLANYYHGQLRNRLSDAVIGSIAAHAIQQDLLLVVPYVPTAQAKKLRSLGIAFIDTVGNAHLRSHGLYIFVTGKRSAIPTEKPVGIFRPAGIKFILALLTAPGIENADYRTLASDTGVPKSTVGELVNDLERGGYLVNRGNKRFLQRKEELIKRWVEVYTEKYRIKLKPIRFTSTKKTGRWWDEIDIAEYNAVWGGETGGAVLTRHLRPQTATIYADSNLAKLQLKYGLVRDPRGELEIVKRFWAYGETKNCAPPLVVYADLIATADERNLETAKLIYDEYLAPTIEENS